MREIARSEGLVFWGHGAFGIGWTAMDSQELRTGEGPSTGESDRLRDHGFSTSMTWQNNSLLPYELNMEPPGSRIFSLSRDGK